MPRSISGRAVGQTWFRRWRPVTSFVRSVDFAGSTATLRMGTEAAVVSTNGGQAQDVDSVADFKM